MPMCRASFCVQSQVLTNANGGIATLSAPQPFSVSGFWYSNPSADSPLTITVTAQVLAPMAHGAMHHSPSL